MQNLIEPFGGSLVNLVVNEQERSSLIVEASNLPSIQLSERSVCDLELLATGGFSPVDGFMRKADYEQVVAEMRLADGTVFPIPITLPVDHFDGLTLDKKIALRDAHNDLLGVMTVEEIYEWSRPQFANNVLGTSDMRHPLITEMEHWGKYNIAGRLQVLALPKHPDFRDLRLTPAQTRESLSRLNRANIVAFQTRNPIHRVHEEMTKLAAEMIDGAILLHPAVGLTKPGDIDYFTRVRTYKTLVENHYDTSRTLLSLLPIAMRMAGPREAVWHAIIRRNHGANHFIIGRDHASPGVDSTGKPFYEPTAAQELAQSVSDEIGVKIMTFGEMAYLPDEKAYGELAKLPAGTRTISLSGTQIREEYLGRSKPLPEWFTRPEIAAILAESYPPPEKQGVCLWFTGLSGAGKSATAEVLTILLNERGRRVTVLDGDVVRTHLSKGLGFSKEDRDLNILRIGFVASEIVRHGGVVICAAVSPYRSTRSEVRQMMGSDNFVEIFVDTPLDVCESRDTKGMYAKARRGEIKGFTGIDDPYEMPDNAEITLDTTKMSVDENADLILQYLASRNLVA
ncbi:MAG TPA: bifunctional sulfate adenylyltransferase/adenylylsulfate kinase [Pyrinomonadaceae bacterium]|nr:bifunctional sulfate adenylyltransferase/adenylylsulfate kinase [Pyrinomonadaceae bacterium]